MRRRPAPPPSAQQMIREYLGRVSDAATKVLPKGDRLLFVGRTRAAIEAKVGPLASADADDVLSALTALGEPEELAKRERERLYSARRRGAAAAPPALWKPSKDSRRGTVPPPPPPARRSGPAQPRRARSWPHRGLTGPESAPPAESVPRPADSPEVTPPAAATSPAEPAAIATSAAEAPAVETPAGDLPTGESPLLAVPITEVPTDEVPTDEVPATEVPTADLPEAGQDGPDRNAPEPEGVPPGWMRPARPGSGTSETKPISIVPGMGEPSEAEEPPLPQRRSPVAGLPAETWALARKHPLEAVSVVLLGVGGLILPFPFWLIGGIVAIKSRRWDKRDKWMALAGPPLFTFAVLLIRAGTSQGNFFSAFYQASHHDVGLSIRAGCVLCAAYLVWRLRRGPRLRSLPPWQRPR